MADTNFVSGVTVIPADWANDVNDAVYPLSGLHTLPPIDIGDWNMDSTLFVVVPHGLDEAKIRSVSALIRSDDLGGGTVQSHMLSDDAGSEASFTTAVGQIFLQRTNAGIFDNTGFDSTPYNRGWIIIQYVD